MAARIILKNTDDLGFIYDRGSDKLVELFFSIAPYVGGNVYYEKPITPQLEHPSFTVGSLIVPEKKTAEGILVKSYAAIWIELAKLVSKDWSIAFQLKPTEWEEMIAGAFHKTGYDEVILTPRSGDHGRDVIASKNGVGSIRILGSMKAYGADHLVTRAHVHEMLGVISSDQRATKGIIATTSDFAPKVLTDPGLARSVPYRLELMNGKALQAWLTEPVKDT